MTTDNSINTAKYNEGRAAFEAGGTLRAIIDQLRSADTDQDFDTIMDGAVGFADAALDKLRGIKR